REKGPACQARRMSISRAELEAFRGATLPDLIGPGLKLLFVGVNPGLRTVAMQAQFAFRGNRFYPALFRAGIVDRLIDASAGLDDADREHLLGRGVGITSLVAGATARADELEDEELVAGAAALEVKVAQLQPAVTAILGVTAYRVAFARPRAALGRQPETIAGRQLWIVPNPSGRNAHAPLPVLATTYREAAVAAGIVPYS
ncbi:MAG TPA: mismatch-specific DNA-glycosylase, partial [Solirubrobacterales bacterium]|nr:mismatch-specific DNA-glycosylase [Solirubrobacterales bacterium]